MDESEIAGEEEVKFDSVKEERQTKDSSGKLQARQEKVNEPLARKKAGKVGSNDFGGAERKT